jgi:hypothetical protein
MKAFDKAPSRVDRAASDEGMILESNDSTDRAQIDEEGGDREAGAVASIDGAAHLPLSDEDGAHRHGHDAEGSRSAGASGGMGDAGGSRSEAGAGGSASEDKDLRAAGGPRPCRRAPFSRLLVFRVTYGQRNRDGRGGAAVGGHSGGRGGALECLASVALRGVCRAVCQHQGYVIAACADRLCVFDLVSTPAPAVAAEAAAEGESSSRRQQGGGGHPRSELRLKKVAEKSMRSLSNSFPMTALSADVWALAVGDAANSVNLWQLAVSAYSGHAVTGLVSSSPGCGSALYVMRRPANVLEMSAP